MIGYRVTGGAAAAERSTLHLSPHKSPADAIEGVGTEVGYLPPYSPDFNPIVNLWSKVKGKLRSLAARSAEALHEAIGAAATWVRRRR